ncbi:Ubiquitin-protein ligase [Didymella sp. IMI 355093]|nr:Ubiquitin-protein ligase [Didymella sp. IMI 355093]
MLNRQIKGLKDCLEKYTIDELPEVTSRTCDICAKDYSATNVQPSEDEELAVMLPCGHVFGEFCIDQWLVEPLPSPYARASYSSISYAFARGSRPFEELTVSDF